jgi:hypothetical protein
LAHLHYEPRTRAYAERRHEGLSKPEIIRCLKRYVAREIFNALPILVAENNSRTHLPDHGSIDCAAEPSRVISPEPRPSEEVVVG